MLRSARPEDATTVAAVLIESRKAFLPFAPSAHEPEEVRSWVSQILVPSGGVTLAISGDKIVAVLAVSEDEAVTWIDQLYVLPGFENQGFGTELLHHVHAMARKPIRLYTFQQNSAARRFYERHGYKVIALSDGQSNEERCPDVLYEFSQLAQLRANPSVEARPNGKAASPAPGEAYHPSAGLGASSSVPPHLER